MTDCVVIFGNCQAEALCEAMRHAPGLDDKELIYVPSFNITAERTAEILADRVRDSCVLLFEQLTPQVNLTGRFEFPRARRITFPSLDINVLWPLRAEEKRSVPELPAYPFGRYTYGDRVINEIVALGLTGEEAWAHYVARSATLLSNIERLSQIERDRWELVERDLDVKMADAVFPRLATERLFWTYNHPTRELLCLFGARILRAAGLAPDDEKAAFDLVYGLLTWEFGADYQQPIHPKVAMALGLTWWSPEMTYRHFEEELSFESFIRRQIAWA